MLRLSAILLCFVLSVAGTRLKDVTGVETQLDHAPQRIVTLIPSLGELAQDLLDDPKRLVGVAEQTQARGKPTIIGPYHAFSLEKVVALKPDLILASKSGNAQDQIEKLRKLGHNVFVVSAESFEEIQTSVEQVSQFLGQPERGSAWRKTFENEMSALHARATKRRKQKIMIQLDQEPIIVSGGSSFLSHAVERVGSVNIYADLKQAYPRVSSEDVLARNPDVILIAAFGKDRAPFEKIKRGWKKFPQLKAVRDQAIFFLESDELFRPSTRVMKGLLDLEKLIFNPS